MHFVHEVLKSENYAFFSRRLFILTVESIRQVRKAVVQDVLNDVPPIEFVGVAGATDQHLCFSKIGVQQKMLVVIIWINLLAFD